MFPGMISKLADASIVASASTISPKGGELVRVTGTTQINTITPPLGFNASQFIIIIPTDGSIVLGTSGNILAGLTIVQNRTVMLIWCKPLQKWLIENGA